MMEDMLTQDESPKSGANLSKILAQLRSKYPELADEPLLDQVEVAAGGPPAEAAPEAPEDEIPSDPFNVQPRKPVDVEPGPAPGAKGKKKKRMSDMPMPEFEAGEPSSDVNGAY